MAYLAGRVRAKSRRPTTAQTRSGACCRPRSVPRRALRERRSGRRPRFPCPRRRRPGRRTPCRHCARRPRRDRRRRRARAGCRRAASSPAPSVARPAGAPPGSGGRASARPRDAGARPLPRRETCCAGALPPQRRARRAAPCRTSSKRRRWARELSAIMPRVPSGSSSGAATRLWIPELRMLRASAKRSSVSTSRTRAASPFSATSRIRVVENV